MGGREGESPLPQAVLPGPSGPVGFGPPGGMPPGPKLSNAEQVGTGAGASPWIPAAPTPGLSWGLKKPAGIEGMLITTSSGAVAVSWLGHLPGPSLLPSPGLQSP